MEQLPHWFEDYNEYHPHKGLKMKSPREHRRELNLFGSYSLKLASFLVRWSGLIGATPESKF
jgi:hypothetical protein